MNGQQLFAVFFAIFWGVVISKLGKYRLFDTHLIFQLSTLKKGLIRFIPAVILANVFPIILFWSLYCRVPCKIDGLFSIFSCAFAALTIFSVNRFVHTFVMWKWNWFYLDQKERDDILIEWRNCRKEYCEALLYTHFLGGILFLFGFWGLALLFAHYA